jgi:hypothetical protein
MRRWPRTVATSASTSFGTGPLVPVIVADEPRRPLQARISSETMVAASPVEVSVTSTVIRKPRA